MLAQAMHMGCFAECPMLVDAETHDRYVSFPESVLPLHMQSSRPDMVLIQGCSHAMDAIGMHDRRSPSWVLHLVEVIVTSDFRVHDVVQRKTDQHETLLQNLRAYGWRDVRLLCILDVSSFAYCWGS